MEISKIVHIYDLSDPITGHIRYVGKSVNPTERLATHIRESRKGSVLHSRRWIAGLIANGLHPALGILESVSVENADEAERFWIAFFRLAGSDLTNRTPGGDGQPPGYKPSRDAVERMRAALRGQKRTPEQLERIRVAFKDPKLVEARRKRQKLLMADPERRAIAARGRLGMKDTSETRKKKSSSWTPERKAAHAAEKSALPVDERWRRQLAAAIKERWDRWRANGSVVTDEMRAKAAKMRAVRSGKRKCSLAA